MSEKLTVQEKHLIYLAFAHFRSSINEKYALYANSQPENELKFLAQREREVVAVYKLEKKIKELLDD